MRKAFMPAMFAVLLFVMEADRVHAQLAGPVNFVVLRVTFSDFPSGSRFTTTQTQTNFNDIATLWGNDTSYGTINIQYQYAGPYQGR
jgi:hypothetical protein